MWKGFQAQDPVDLILLAIPSLYHPGAVELWYSVSLNGTMMVLS
jgi:hypothetical protein